MLFSPNGSELVRQEKVEFSADDVRLIRRYKLLLQKYGLGATHWCRACQKAERDFDVRIVANASKVEFECPHRLITFSGHTL